MTQEQKQALFEKQKEMLDTFLKTGAITAAQHETSLGTLRSRLLGSAPNAQSNPSGR